MVPNSSPRAFEGVRSPLQRFFPTGLFVDWELFYFFYGGCARAHPPGVAPEPFGGMVLFLQRLLPPSAIVWSILSDRLRVLYMQRLFPWCEEAPEPFPQKGRSGSFSSYNYVPHSSFRSEEGWAVPYYPRWASDDASRELQAGRSKRMSEPHSIGVG